MVFNHAKTSYNQKKKPSGESLIFPEKKINKYHKALNPKSEMSSMLSNLTPKASAVCVLRRGG
jgi:hypothetical protein